MKVTTANVTRLTLTELAEFSLDPVTVILEDYAKGQGKIIIECYGSSWSSYWGAMGGRSVAQFFIDCDSDYLIGCMSHVSQKRFDSEALKQVMKRALLAARRDYSMWGKSPASVDRFQLLPLDAGAARNAFDELDSIYDGYEFYNLPSHLMEAFFGIDWMTYASQYGQVPNDDYLYLERIVKAVQAGLAESLKSASNMAENEAQDPVKAKFLLDFAEYLRAEAERIGNGHQAGLLYAADRAAAQAYQADRSLIPSRQ
ncbi:MULTISPECIES: hypothetical protein [Pseudomonas]|uniref:Uncharacterized protein n=1 Tax=Pseudomonas lutea TaxID=243924 RepID=A0A9X8MH24_9PSED|nr:MULTISPECIES: hypothetical protein [Pseudomonas]SER36307.1 hypothetical protein SAMN05216409_11846 [Pseudomonas lutea]